MKKFCLIVVFFFVSILVFAGGSKMTGRQLEALFLTYDDMKNQGRDLSVYQISIDIDVKNIIMNVVYSIQPNDGGSQRGGTKINPEVHYVVNVKDLKIVKITYGK